MLQGLHSVRSADLDNLMPGAQVTQLRRSRTTGKPMPAVQQPLLSQVRLPFCPLVHLALDTDSVRNPHEVSNRPVQMLPPPPLYVLRDFMSHLRPFGICRLSILRTGT